MTKQQAINHFRSVAKLARALGISYEAVRQWDVVPELRQYQLEKLTNGALKSDAQETVA